MARARSDDLFRSGVRPSAFCSSTNSSTRERERRRRFLHTRRLLQERGDEVIDFAMQHDANLPSPYESFFAPERSYDAGGATVKRAADAASSGVLTFSAEGACPSSWTPTARMWPICTISTTSSLFRSLTSWRRDGFRPCSRCTIGRSHVLLTLCSQKDNRAGGVHRATSPQCRTTSMRKVIGTRQCDRGHRGMDRPRRRASYSKVQRFIAPSRFAIDIAALVGVSKRRIAHVPNFLPDDELNIDRHDEDAGARAAIRRQARETKGFAICSPRLHGYVPRRRCGSPAVARSRTRFAPRRRRSADHLSRCAPRDPSSTRNSSPPRRRPPVAV